LIDILIKNSLGKIDLDVVSMMFEQKDIKWNNLYRVIQICPQATDMIINQFLSQENVAFLSINHLELLISASGN
jgi:hypothetical protein